MPTLLVTVISHKRPQNVKRLASVLQHPDNAVWIVGSNEKAAYKAHGAKYVFEGGSLCPSRNMAIELARKYRADALVQISDDVSQIMELVDDHEEIITAEAAAGIIWKKMKAAPLESRPFLGGAYPCANPWWARRSPETSKDLFIVGDFLVVDPLSPVRFDEKLEVKEDYDFTLSHMKMHGSALRNNRLIVVAKHRNNPGGAVGPDRERREVAAIKLLKTKWPAQIVDHPRRRLEVLLKRASKHGQHKM